MDDPTEEPPDFSNFFCELTTSLSRSEVADLYERKGWDVRKCTWVDFEIRCPWAELVIEAEQPILMHGPVANVLAHAEDILAPLRSAGIAFSAECNGPGDELLAEFYG